MDGRKVTFNLLNQPPIASSSKSVAFWMMMVSSVSSRY